MSTHLTRPKSSKGRKRASSLFIRDPGSGRRPAGCSAGSSRAGGVPSRSQLRMVPARRSTCSWSPAAPPHSFNKYPVLPPIRKKQPEEERRRILNKDTSSLDGLQLSDDAATQSCSGAEGRGPGAGPPEPPQPAQANSCSSLLLVIRTPCGRRFQEHFSPADTLLAVKVLAEAGSGYSSGFGQVCIETMDVPRRTFTNLDMTLEQCGILNKSVLCISHEEHVEQ